MGSAWQNLQRLIGTVCIFGEKLEGDVAVQDKTLWQWLNDTYLSLFILFYFYCFGLSPVGVCIWFHPTSAGSGSICLTPNTKQGIFSWDPLSAYDFLTLRSKECCWDHSTFGHISTSCLLIDSHSLTPRNSWVTSS